MLCRILLTILCVLAWGSSAHAQALQRVTNCGDGNPPAGASPGTQDATGQACVTGAGGAVPTKPGLLTPLGQCQLSVTTAVFISTCSGGIPAGATIAFVTTETAAIRWRDDGTAPSTTVGMPLAVGAQLTYSGTLSALKVIAQSGTAIVDIDFVK